MEKRKIKSNIEKCVANFTDFSDIVWCLRDHVSSDMLAQIRVTQK